MADYREMYYILCAAAAKAIDAPTEDVNELLQGALYEAEEIYIRTCEENKQQSITGANAEVLDILGLSASVKAKLISFSSERETLCQQMELLELRKAELQCEEERLKTMSVKQLLETNHVLQDSLAKQLDDLQDRYASLYISNDMKRQDIYKMVDKLCQTAPLDHIYVALRQLLFKAQERA